MRIILGLLTTLVTILYLLDRMGIDLGGLNPFYWRRRRAWAAQYEGDPVYSVEEPMLAAALLVAGVAKLDGDLSAEQKSRIRSSFESVFSLDTNAAGELLGSAAHLLGGPQVIDTQLDGVSEKHKQRFSADQAESIIQMIDEVVATDGEPTPKQRDYIARIRSLYSPSTAQGDWA